MASAYPIDDRVLSVLRSVTWRGTRTPDTIYYNGYKDGYLGNNPINGFTAESQPIYDMGYDDGKGDQEIDRQA